ncbi:pseudouridine synthase [Mycoplasmopsis gallopavonis]|uniref:Pseudouridine synthase n=1 Tax=Mycoplasmopsis gallopavonis TaxID=76629 RepID=A0A449AZS2_9BACT|nr:pseudouridine synthase [Mycoplasmopsis gallopavonis]RIV16910.1 rRNA pseudouridine synthase [Mycoplasmopsis gallopavonis]VEU73010.1 Pseudouridine synthase [Mycoplasmopsis gallopavonis]
MEQERLQKLLSKAGIASRREAEELINQGKVTVNGQVATLGQKATFKDDIRVNGQKIQEEKKVYFILNKPPKTICTLKDNFNRTKVTDLIDTPYKIFPVGRLDYDTTGVLLLTNDGELANKLIHPKYKILRVYRARINQPLTKQELAKLNKPVLINKTFSSQTVIPIEGAPKSYFVILSVGTYHHVKLLFNAIDKEVINLKRVEFAGLTVKGIPVGEYRQLNMKELKTLKLLTKD